MSSKRSDLREAVASSPSSSGHPTPTKSRGKRKLTDELHSHPDHTATPRNATTGNSVRHTPDKTPPSRTYHNGHEIDDPRPKKRRSLHRRSEGGGSGRGNFEHSVTSDLAGSSLKTSTFADMYTFRSKHAATTQIQNGTADPLAGKGTFGSPIRNGMAGPVKSAFNPHQGPRKLVVKNIKTAPREDKNVFFERKWKELSSSLGKLFEDVNARVSLEELYKSAEYVCRQGMSQELFERLKELCHKHLDTTVKFTLLGKAEISSAIESLRAFTDAWTLWQKQVQIIRQIFFYLNQTYLLRSATEPDLEVMGTQLYQSIVFQQPTIRSQVSKGVMELVDLDRNGTISDGDAQLAKLAISSFHDLGVYTSDVEPLLLSLSKDFFLSWRKSTAESADLPHYVRSCTELDVREMHRCDSWMLDRSTRQALSEQVDEILVHDNLARLTSEDAVLDMFEADQTEEIGQTYQLLKRIKQENLLAGPFGKHIELEGSTIVFDDKKESEMVVRLLQFKRKLDSTHHTAFEDSEMMGNTLHKAFEVFVNKTKKTQANWDTDNAKPGEMIAKHVDLLLKGGPKAVPGLRSAGTEEEQDLDDDGGDDKEVEKHLDDALDLFRFVQGKAVFEAFYKKDLARRLLMGRTQSFDAERNMLTRLKNECGAGFTHNLESMFKDMDLAREEMKSYSQLLSDRGIRPKPDMSVNVLSVAAWPTYNDIPVNVPTLISKAQADFEKHYKEKHVGRKLAWKPALATCQLRASFAKGNKEIVVSGFQAIVLLLFNEIPLSQSLSYADIKTATALPDNELSRTLQSLACAKYRVLTKSPKGREVNTTDTFTFNNSFTDNKLRIKINQIQLKETKEENKETHQRVAADRHYETQAAIVRIMKGRKVVGHNELIVEVIKATRSRGVLDQADIKKNIEKLIEKEYMERDEDVKNGYRYLA